jgi:hypothetical protein
LTRNGLAAVAAAEKQRRVKPKARLCESWDALIPIVRSCEAATASSKVLVTAISFASKVDFGENEFRAWFV